MIGYEQVDRFRRKFFAVPANAPRDRRPTDVTMLVFTSIVVALYAFRAGSRPRGLEAAVDVLMRALPAFLDPLWRIAHDVLIAWALFIVLVAAVRRHWGLVRDLAISGLALVCVAAVITRIVSGSWPDLLQGLFGVDEPVAYPAAGLALWVCFVSVASSHLSRPYRYFGRWLVASGSFATVALGVATVSETIGAAALGFGIAAAVHLVFGSPGGLPSLAEVRDALAGLGVDAEPVSVMRQSGVVRVRALNEHGADLDVKVYGRDAWDGQLIVTVWRFFWYRDSGPTLALTRLQQVEHEAFLTLLAERRGAPVNPVVAAGTDPFGDAMMVIRRLGRPLSELVATETPVSEVSDLPAGAGLVDGVGASMWRSLAALHAAGITHGSIEPERVFIDGESVMLADLANSEVGSPSAAFLVDRAQLLATSAVAFGTEAAIADAGEALGTAGLADVSSYLQPAALSIRLRRALARAELDVDDIRDAAVSASGGEKRDLQKLRRLSWGSVLMAAVLFFAGWRLVTQLIDVGLATIVEAVSEASLPIVICAYFVSTTARFSNAVALSGLAPIRVPLVRLFGLQMAQTFVNLAMPGTAARVAVNIRFFERSGVAATPAVAAGAIDGFTGFLCQITLMGGILLLGLGTLEFHIDESFSLDNVGWLLLALAIALVAGIAVVALVPALRRRVVELVMKVREFVVPFLRSPRRLLTALSANMVAEILGAMTLYVVLLAFGQTVPIPDIILVSIGVSLFAGLMPVPGGIGVTEAALTAGFIAMGVPDATAFAAALTSRVVTFYFPPLPGWFFFRWMQRQRYL